MVWFGLFGYSSPFTSGFHSPDYRRSDDNGDDEGVNTKRFSNKPGLDFHSVAKVVYDIYHTNRHRLHYILQLLERRNHTMYFISLLA